MNLIHQMPLIKYVRISLLDYLTNNQQNHLISFICNLINYKYSDITGAVIGSAMQVHSALGNGFPEVIYQRSLAIEFKEQGINYKRELSMPLYYKEKSVGRRRVDFLVEEKVLVELKAISEINKTHFNQILNYLTAYELEIGLLINFGENSLKFKRFINSKYSAD